MPARKGGRRKSKKEDSVQIYHEPFFKSQPPKKPYAAVRERERLRVFNESLESLQKVIPVRLPAGRKLHKKQTLQLASRYIQFLRDCLDGKRDFEERRRFWCSNDDDLNMIDAIDAAAASNEPEMTSPPRNRRRTKDQSHASGLYAPTNGETVEVKPVILNGYSKAPQVQDEIPTHLISKHSTVSLAGLETIANRVAPVYAVPTATASAIFHHIPPLSSVVARTRAIPPLDDVWSDLSEIISTNE